MLSVRLSICAVNTGRVVREVSGGIPVVVADGEFDIANVDFLRTALWSALDEAYIVVVDFTGVTFADSTVLGVIVGAHKKAVAAGGQLRLVLPVASAVVKIFDITGVSAAVQLFESREAASTIETVQ